MLSTFLFLTEVLMNSFLFINSDICLVLIILLLYCFNALSMFLSLPTLTIIILKYC